MCVFYLFGGDTENVFQMNSKEKIREKLLDGDSGIPKKKKDRILDEDPDISKKKKKKKKAKKNGGAC